MTEVIAGKILPPEPDPRIDPRDPPVFLLQASATWAPWLNDGMYQRVPVGATGQVLTVNADGSIGWANSSAGFGNPMTGTGDIIVGSAGGAPVRLAIGANGNVLAVVSGTPGWEAPPWMTNPMTTSQDLILGGAAGAPGRLGVGANGQVLGITAGAVGWVTNPAGFTNPMTTLGDLITGASGGTAQRLPTGSNGQVLLVAGGVPAWGNSPAGFANPMTTSGDMIIGGLAGVATRLPAGANGLVLTLVSGAPAWVAGASGASAVVFPSGDATGVKDQAAITAAFPAAGGEVLLASGAFYVKPVSGANCLVPPVQTVVAPQGSAIAGSPVCMRGLGASTIIYPVGTGVTGIYYHRTSAYGAQFGLPAQPTTGYLRDFVVDGSLALGASVGVDVGDGWGYDINVRCVNFTGTGGIGFQLAQDVFWCEKGDYRLELINNTTAAVMTTRRPQPAGDHSHEYNRYWISIFCNLNQNGIVFNGVNESGCELDLRGNMQLTSAASGAPTSNVAAISVINTIGSSLAQWSESSIRMKVEANAGQGGGAVWPYSFYSDGNGAVVRCEGRLTRAGLTAANWNNAEFSFRGMIADPVLAQLVTGPAGTNTTYANHPASIASGSTTVTLTDGATGYAVGSAVMWVPPSPGGGYAVGTVYYVVAQSSNTIQLATSPGGAAISASANGSGTLDPIGPPMPASGALQQNYGPDAMLYITGGTGVSVVLQASPAPYSASIQNPYFVPAAGSVTVTYTTAPTWNWVPCSQSQY